MIKLIVAAIIALAAQPQDLSIVCPEMNIAAADVNKIESGNLPSPELPDQDPEALAAEPDQEPEQLADQEAELEEFYTEPQEEMPTPADEFAYSEWIPLGVYHVTHYSAEACGNAIGARGRPGGLIEGESIAMPEDWMLGHTVLVEGYGFFTVDDISPDGVADIFHWYEKDAVGEDWQMVYLMQ